VYPLERTAAIIAESVAPSAMT
jgi:hypothetical protein